ncbi:MAG: M28 family peptidase [Acidobacteria bacterium]|nr:M28 family peptidase [Acidobacteriota bacterium]
MKPKTLLLTMVIAAAAWAASPKAPQPTQAMRRAEAAITGDLIRAHTAFLSDDLLEGRAPASRGSELAAKYIAAQYERLGLEPVGPNGTYFQNVPMVGKKVDPAAQLGVGRDGQELTFNYFDDFVAGSDLEQERVAVRGELVFVGYGVIAPEFKWDDFKGADLKGKVLLMLVNDPPATPEEPELFGGKALTYYGRWTYKYESAARQGAAGAILIHTPESAGYPFTVVQSSWSGESFSLPRKPGGDPPLELKSWISQAAAEKILGRAGQSLAALQQAAARRDFRPVPFGLQASTELAQTVRRIESPNIIGLLEGSDPRLKNEYLIYTAHYDHLGVGKAVNGDAIYNGASDNALGVAHLLAIAEAMGRLEPRPKRSQVFLAVTAEEAGLLGSAYYAENPVFAPAQTAANINIDGPKTWGPTRDVIQIGAGKSELDAVAERVAHARGLTTRPDEYPEQGFFYRSDQFNLAKVGIPALYIDNGEEIIGQPAGYGAKKEAEYRARDYHQPSDVIKPDWDWRGAEQMARFLFEVGWTLSNWDRDFAWYPNAEFRAARLESRRPAGTAK